MSEFSKEVEDYFCKFTFGQFVTIILLELVTLFFVFYLGAHYGPDLIGGRRETAKIGEEEGPQERKVDLTYPEALPDETKKTVVRIKPSGITAMEYERVEKPSPVIVPAPEKIEEAPVVVKEKLAEKNEKPVEVIKEEPQGGLFSIQVGSYKSPEEATSQIEKWKGKGYSTYMAVVDLTDKGRWYRVRIGRFKSKTEADSFLKKFKEKERSEALVVSQS